jgi:hypothetical protein
MSDAEMTANGTQVIESVEMTQKGPNLFLHGGTRIPQRIFSSQIRLCLSRTRMGTFRSKLRHLNIYNSLEAKSVRGAEPVASRRFVLPMRLLV